MGLELEFGELSAADGVVRDELSSAAFADDDDRAVRHALVIPDRLLDFSDFDAIPADLHLLVTTANKSQPPVPQPPPDVAGPIQPLAGPVGVGHHVLGRERWTVAVAPHQARAPDEDLPFDSLGHELQVPVEDVYVHAVDGLADRRQGRFTSLT